MVSWQTSSIPRMRRMGDMKTKCHRGGCNHSPFSSRTFWVHGIAFVSAIFLMLIAPPVTFAAEKEPASAHGPLAAEWLQGNWAKTFGGIWTDEAASIQMTDDDGFILAGHTFSFVANPGYEDAWILKLGSHGEVEWEKTFGGALWDSIHSIQQTADGGYVAAGIHYPPGGSQEAWVLKLNGNGQVDWQYAYGRDFFSDGAWSVQQTSDHGFIVLGWTQSYALGGERGAWVFKLSENGSLEWQKFFDGDRWDALFSAVQTADGGYILAGGSYALSPDPWFSDVWVIKLFPDGSVDWQKTFGGNANDVAYAVQQTADGGFILASWTGSFGSGGGDIWILRLNESGSLLWQKSYGGEWSDVPSSLKVTADGGCLVGGYTASYGLGRYDGWVFKLASNGRIEWGKTFGGPSDDVFSDIVETPSGYVATGTTRSYGAGEKDVWVLRFSPSGPGAFLLQPISRHSTTMGKSTDGTEQFVVGNNREIEGVSALSLTTSSTTSAEQNSLAVFPGNSWLIQLLGRRDRPNQSASWPVIQTLRGGPRLTTVTP